MLSLPGHVAHLNKEALVPAREKPEHPAHAQGQSSPLWPQSSVGGGMAAGAAFAHPRAADGDARVRPISEIFLVTQMSEIKYIHATSLMQQANMQ